MRQKRGAIRSTTSSSPRAQSTTSSIAAMVTFSMAAQITTLIPAVVLGWLARASDTGGRISDVLPLCRDHVWQSREVAGPILAPALAAVILREAEQRLFFAAPAAAAYRESPRLLDRLGRVFGTGSPRRAALSSLSRGRECPLCARAGEAGERALALV